MVEDLDESLKPMTIEAGSRIAKGISRVASRRIVCWRRDADNYPVLKDIVSNANKDAIILQARGQKLPDAEACASCQDERGPFSCCVFDNITSPPMGFGACINYI